VACRFGETLPVVDNMFVVEPFETGSRHLRTISDWANYKKLHSSLPAVAAASFKARVKSGDIKAVREVWEKKDKTFLAVDFEWSERNHSSVLEWGYAAVRCSNLTVLAIFGVIFRVYANSVSVAGLVAGLLPRIRTTGPCLVLSPL
jgi:hypothetical protein